MVAAEEHAGEGGDVHAVVVPLLRGERDRRHRPGDLQPGRAGVRDRAVPDGRHPRRGVHGDRLAGPGLDARPPAAADAAPVGARRAHRRRRGRRDRTGGARSGGRGRGRGGPRGLRGRPGLRRRCAGPRGARPAAARHGAGRRVRGGRGTRGLRGGPVLERRAGHRSRPAAGRGVPRRHRGVLRLAAQGGLRARRGQGDPGPARGGRGTAAVRPGPARRDGEEPGGDRAQERTGRPAVPARAAGGGGADDRGAAHRAGVAARGPGRRTRLPGGRPGGRAGRCPGRALGGGHRGGGHR